MTDNDNRTRHEGFEDFLVREARLDEVAIGGDAIDIVYRLDGDPLRFSVRYDSIRFSDPAFGSASRVELFAETLAVVAFLRFGSVLPRRLDLGKHARCLDPRLLAFLKRATGPGWSEHRYQLGQLDYTGPEPIVGETEIGRLVDYPIFSAASVPESADVILASGSGKDSVLCGLLLQEAGLSYDIATYLYDVYGANDEQESLFDQVNNHLSHKNKHTIYLHDEYYPWLERRMERTGLRARLKDRFAPKPFRTEAGEVVLSAFLIAPPQIARGVPAMAFGNEKSADTPNLTSPTGEPIAHQWAKSFDTEKEMAKLFASMFQGVHRVSLTKPIHDLTIFPTLFRLGGDLPYATNSCNIEKPWCGRCEKCCYVFAGFCAYGDYDKTVAAFGQDLFRREDTLPVWEDVLGLKDRVAWECVGEPEEARYYFHKLHQRGVRNPAMDLFERKCLAPLRRRGDVDAHFQAIERKYARVYDNHHTMPDWLWSKIRNVLEPRRAC